MVNPPVQLDSCFTSGGWNLFRITFWTPEFIYTRAAYVSQLGAVRKINKHLIEMSNPLI